MGSRGPRRTTRLVPPSPNTSRSAISRWIHSGPRVMVTGYRTARRPPALLFPAYAQVPTGNNDRGTMQTSLANSYTDAADRAVPPSMHHGACQVIRRAGDSTPFEAAKISVALIKAFLAVEGDDAAASRRIRETVEALTAQVTDALLRRLPAGGTLHFLYFLHLVYLALLRGVHHMVARAFVLIRLLLSRRRLAGATVA